MREGNLRDLASKADSYLDHILIAARVGDKSSGLWRNMLDNWNCYTRGHPFVASNGAGQPHWFNRADVNRRRAALEAMHRRSRLADAAILRQNSEIVVVDHVVPVNVMRDMLLERGAGLTRADVVDFLQTYYRLCVITPGEHDRLNSGIFHRTRVRPDAFWSRYEAAAIELVED